MVVRCVPVSQESQVNQIRVKSYSLRHRVQAESPLHRTLAAWQASQAALSGVVDLLSESTLRWVCPILGDVIVELGDILPRS